MFTNLSNIDMPVAVWLAASNGYDLKFNPDVISATELLDPVKSIVLSRKLREEEAKVHAPDISSLVASKLGSAVHEAIEQAWIHHRVEALRALHVPDQLIARIKINPENPSPNDFPIYMEQRSSKRMGKWIVSGKFDFVMEGTVVDFKTTGTYTWIAKSNVRKYTLQGSIYKWLNPEIITADVMRIEYIFTDWKALQAQADSNYPPKQIISENYPLMTLERTEAWIAERLRLIEEQSQLDQTEMTSCTPKELWQDPPKWAYYKSTDNMKRATRVFDLAADAYKALNESNGQGVVVERAAEVKFCRYCKAQPACMQAKYYIDHGLLKL